MKVHLDCFPCFLRQSIIALRLATEDEAVQEAVLKGTLEFIQNADVSKSPAHTTTFIHRRIREMLGKDPFESIKSQYNRIALDLYPSMRDILAESADPLETCARLAIAGNIIDFGIFTSIDIEGTVDRALKTSPAVNDYSAFRDAVSDTEEVLYLLDNAGEIVFDRLLIECLAGLGKKVKAVVKGAPVINDSTIVDAEESGLTRICEVIQNGSDAVGTILPWTSSEFQRDFEKAQLIISKGQGNFETLAGTDKNIFFLFQSKCHVVSNDLGLARGAMLLRKS